MTGPVRPFPVDPEVLARIRPMRATDAEAAAALHAAGMGRSLWARLGTPFLAALYRGLVDQAGFVGFVYDDGRVRGLIAGTEDSRALFTGLGRSLHRLALPAAAGLAREPRIVLPLVETAAYFARSGDGGARMAESLFCAVETDLRGNRTAGHLNKVLFDELAVRGHRVVKVTTEADNEGANRQLRSWGFVAAARFRFYGKDMVRYELDLAASPRVEPVRRLGT